MPGRHWWAAVVVAAGAAPLTGCMNLGPGQAYPGKKLPDYRTVLIKRGPGVDSLGYIDGLPAGNAHIHFGLHWAGPRIESPHTSVRVLPGQHELDVHDHKVVFYAEAGQSYTVFGSEDEPKTIWVEDRTGTVVWGERPPQHRTAEPR